MATTNPRITVTLAPEVHAVLRRLARLAGNSQSAIVGDLLLSSLPVFDRMVKALEAAELLKQEGMKAPQAITDSLGRAQARLEKQLDLALGDMDEGIRPMLQAAEKVSRRAAGGRGRGGTRSAGEPRPRTAAGVPAAPTPVPVTRGSGTPKSRSGIAKATQQRQGQQPPKKAGKGVSRGKV